MSKEDIQQEINILAEASTKLYNRLLWGLEKITNVKGYLVLPDLEYVKYSENDIPIDIPTHDICKENFGTNDQGEDTYLCACGKPHIKKLSIVKYDNPKLDFKYIILGTECIKTTIDFLHKTGEIHHLKTKLLCWYSNIMSESKKYKNNACFSCGEYNIPKKTDYKKEYKKYWCKKCVGLGGKVKCISCGKLRFYMDSPTTKQPMLYCRDCFYNHNVEKISFTQKKRECLALS